MTTVVEIIGHHRRTHSAVVNETLAADIERAFVLIPRTECAHFHKTTLIPSDIFDDEAALEQGAVAIAAGFASEAFQDGVLVISRPEFELAEPVWPGIDTGVPEGAELVRVTALVWRLPDADPYDEDDYR